MPSTAIQRCMIHSSQCPQAQSVSASVTPKPLKSRENVAQPTATASTSSSISSSAPTWYSLSLYRYPPAFFPSIIPNESDGKTNPFLPHAPSNQSEKPALAADSVASVPSPPPPKPGVAYEEDDDPQRFMLLRVSRFSPGNPSTVQSVVLDLDDSIQALKKSLEQLMSPHVTIKGFRLDRGFIKGLFNGGQRYQDLLDDLTLRDLLAKGSVHVQYDLKDGVRVDRQGLLAAPKKQNQSESSETAPAAETDPSTISTSSSTPSSSSSSSSPSHPLPVLVLNGGQSIRHGDASFLRTRGKFVMLFCILFICVGSNIFFGLKTNYQDRSDKIEMRLLALQKRDEAQKLAKAEQKAAAEADKIKAEQDAAGMQKQETNNSQ